MYPLFASCKNNRMSSGFEITFLGTATSIGVPVIGCDCPVCTSDDPKNQRCRCSIHVRAPDGLSWIVDSDPDLRYQCLREGITHIDAALFTHEHSDHIMGFDDLRRFTVGADAELPIYAGEACLMRIKSAFHYAFNGENRYIGYLKPVPRVIEGPFEIGETRVVPLPVLHGKVDTMGFLFEHEGGKAFAYIPDAKLVPPETLDLMRGVDVLILDALQEKSHPTHLCIAESVEIAREVGARETWFTHFSCRMDYRTVEPTLPGSVGLAWDRMKVMTSPSAPAACSSK